MSGLQQDMEKRMMEAIQERVVSIQKEEVDKAKENIERRLRDMTAEIVLSISNHYSVTARGEELIIHVRHKFPENGETQRSDRENNDF